jgi:hypothetical protein
MRTAVSIGVFGILLLHGCASAEEWKQYKYPKAGFTAEFTGTVREIDLKPDAKTRAYIRNTSIFAQAGPGFSYSVTAREYRFGTPDIRTLGSVVADRLHCSANVKSAPVAGGGLALSGDGCLSNGSSFVARLLPRGRWFYQALAVVPPNHGKDAGQFVAALHLTDVSRPEPPHHSAEVAHARVHRKAARARPARSRAAVSATSRMPQDRFATGQNWQSPYPANPAAPAAQDWFGSYARAR